MSDHEHFEAVGSGASHTIPAQAGSIKKGGFVMLKGRPCRVVDVSTSKTGKHGHAKAHIVGIDIFNERKYEDMCPTGHNMEVPIVVRQEYQLVGIDDNFCSLLSEGGDMKEDLGLPTETDGSLDETAKRLQKAFNDGNGTIIVSVLSACGFEKIVSFKTTES